MKVAVKALNNVLDEGLPLHPLQEQRDTVTQWRQIGLGLMGLADMLIKMNLTYGSASAIALCDAIGQTMADTAIKTSAKLAKKQGAYPAYNGLAIKDSPFYQNNVSEKTNELVNLYGLRNSQLLTTAPTGTLSTMLGISGGIEPIFATSYTRKTESLHGHDEYYKVYTPIVQEYMETHGITREEDLPEWFVTAQQLDYKARLDMQAIWQQHIDASISSTVNLPQETTIEQVEDLYMYAWEQGLKGVTIFRDGCKRTGILTTKKDKEEDQEDHTVDSYDDLPRGYIVKAGDTCVGKKRTLTTGCGTLHCEAFFDPDTGDLLETYLSKGSTGGCNNYMIGLSRMISLAARGGVGIKAIVDQLKSSGACPSYAVRRATQKDTSPGSCCPVAVGNALLDMYKEMRDDIGVADPDNPSKAVAKPPKKIQPTQTNLCPICGEPLKASGGCYVCPNDGYSKCD